jgi:hypothetical protein
VRIHRMRCVRLTRTVLELFLEHCLVADGVAPVHAFRLVPDLFMAVDRGTPTRSRSRTAVRRNSWRMRPDSPAP